MITIKAQDDDDGAPPCIQGVPTHWEPANMSKLSISALPSHNHQHHHHHYHHHHHRHHHHHHHGGYHPGGYHHHHNHHHHHRNHHFIIKVAIIWVGIIVTTIIIMMAYHPGGYAELGSLVPLRLLLWLLTCILCHTVNLLHPYTYDGTNMIKYTLHVPYIQQTNH